MEKFSKIFQLLMVWWWWWSNNNINIINYYQWNWWKKSIKLFNTIVWIQSKCKWWFNVHLDGCIDPNICTIVSHQSYLIGMFDQLVNQLISYFTFLILYLYRNWFASTMWLRKIWHVSPNRCTIISSICLHSSCQLWLSIKMVISPIRNGYGKVNIVDDDIINDDCNKSLINFSNRLWTWRTCSNIGMGRLHDGGGPLPALSLCRTIYQFMEYWFSHSIPSSYNCIDVDHN